MKRVGFILKPDKTESGKLLDDLVPWLVAGGHQPIVLDEDGIAPRGAEIVPEDELARESDLAVVLGGDGTILRASALIGEQDVPVLGINLGRLGFLTPFDPAEAREAIEGAMSGGLATNDRWRQQVTYYAKNEAPVSRIALNDTVIHQGAMARLIELEAEINAGLLTSYRADGLIVSTPTGSTAYNLAAGGPILMPGQAAMVLTPICAHTLTNRPLVVPKDAIITLRLGGDSRGVVLTIDGQWAHSFMPGDRVEIATAQPLKMFDSGKSYFDILKQKLKWGARADE